MKTTGFPLAFCVLACWLTTATVLNAQERIPQIPAVHFNYSDPELPLHFLVNTLPGPGQNAVIDNDNTPADNPTTDAGATLGRVLFYDLNLSQNQTKACASCHQQISGFSDPEVKSIGFEGGLTRRHSMGLANARFYLRGRFFWDERATSLEDQVLHPIQDSVEMGLTLDELEARIQNLSYYDNLFTDAFGDNSVTSDRVAMALAQFVRSIVSASSIYDQARADVSNPDMNFPSFSDEENLGKRLFMRPPGQGGFGCVGCHTTEAQLNNPAGPSNNGLDSPPVSDNGAWEVFGTPNTLGAFKVPSLRNIEIRPPYMHDGRFATLAEVVEHYNSGIRPHPNLHPALTTNGRPGGPPIRMNMTQAQKDALVAFMRTLTDYELLTDEKFADPFRVRGDGNGDGQFNSLDIDPFVLALVDPAAYAAQFPTIDANIVLDFNNDQLCNSLDIDGFVERLLGN